MKQLSRIALRACVLLSPLAHAAPGDLDTAFGGGDGLATTADSPAAVVRQASGRLVMSSYDSTTRGHTGSGDVDGSFSGCQAAGFSVQPVTASLVRLAGEGLAVSGSLNGYFSVLRCLQDGMPDVTFGTSGLVQFAPGGYSGTALAIIEQDDRQMAAAGNLGNDHWAVARFDATGQPDAGFGSGGVAIPVVPGSPQEHVYGLLQQADGKLVLTGFSQVVDQLHATTVRLNRDGSLDTGFNGSGIENAHTGEAHGAIQQRDGKLLVYGVYNFSGALWRYNADGTPDSQFGSGGVVSLSQAYPRSVIQQHDGRLVVAGYQSLSGKLHGWVARFALDGTKDSAFSGTGYQAAASRAYDVLEQPDGKLVVLGEDNASHGLLLRLQNDDTLSQRQDYDNDGYSDVLLLNTGSGGTQYWPAARKALAVYPGAYDTRYVYAASGDFDGDGKADLLFKRTTTRATAIWDGASKSAVHYPGTAIAGFDVVAACDTDGDGRDDIVWSNAASGGTQIWPAATKTSVRYPGVQNTGYRVVACADFDHNGKADLFWRNAVTGANEVWPGGVKGFRWFPGAYTDSAWQVIGAGDIDSDGAADLVWYRAATGGTQVWHGGIKTAASFPGANALSFVPVAIADYNGDSKADLLWANPTTGGLQVWPGLVKAAATYPGSYAAGLEAQD